MKYSKSSFGFSSKIYKASLIFFFFSFISFNTTIAQSSVFNVSGIPIKFLAAKRSFKTNPTTSSTSNGTNVGDIAVYSDVVKVGSTFIDCIVKVKSISSNASITTFDNVIGDPDSMFCPRADFPSGGGEIKFEFSFIESGTYSNSTRTGTLVKLINAVVNIYDIDISTSSSSKQFNKIDRVFNYVLGSPTDLVVSYDSAVNMTKFQNSKGNSTVFSDEETRAKINYDTIDLYNFIVGQTGSGAAFYYIDFSIGPVFTSAISGGAISANQIICYNGDPAAFTSVSAATGFSNLQYRWQYSSDGGVKYADISSTNSATYNHPSGVKKNLHFRRKAFSSSAGSDTAFSNVVTVTIPTTYTWKGTNSSSYKLATNWIEGCVPHYKSNISFSTTPSVICSLDSSVNLTNITIGGNSSTHVFDLNNYNVSIYRTLSTQGRNIDARDINSKLTFKGTAAQTLPNNALIDNLIANIALENNAGLDLTDTVILTQKMTLTAGTIKTNGLLTFNSDADYTAVIEEVGYSNAINGNVIVEKYVPALRAFRFITPTVTTTTSIRANWQEGGTSWDNNPNPGFGTHITGPSAYRNGVDSTMTQNYSMFSFNNITGTWNAITNTLTNTLTAGTPYRLMVRGDRSLNIYQMDNFPTPRNTILRTTGTLKTGSYSVSNLSPTSQGDNFIGNPYQCDVDIDELLNTATDLNTNFVYMWDPFMNTRGAYATVPMPTGTIIPSGTSASRYLRPGQGFFIKTATGSNLNPSLTFNETMKFSGINTTSTSNFVETPFPNSNSIDITLVNLDSNVIADGISIQYQSNFDNKITDFDAKKIGNLDETISIDNQGQLLGIERRNSQIERQEIIQLNIQKHRASHYTLRIQKNGYKPTNTKLYDNYLDIFMEIPSDKESEYKYSIDSDPKSSAANRFSLIASNEITVNEEQARIELMDNLQSAWISPNPMLSQAYFTVGNLPLQSSEINCEITNIHGALLFKGNFEVSNGEIHVPLINTIETGIYMVRINSKHSHKTFKINVLH
jgi:hypothetical protein